MTAASAKERLNSISGLNCLVQALVGKRLIIDLRNEATVIGDIVEVDGFMNVSMEKVVLNDGNEDVVCYDTLYIKGRHIRFIHIPKELSVRETIINFLKKSRPRRSQGQTTALQRLKAAKLRDSQEETKRNISEQKTRTDK